MNKWIASGRLTKDPDIRTYGEQNDKKMARFTLACDRRGRREEGEQTADFINCVCYGSRAEFADNYLRQGMKIIVDGRIQSGSYTNKDGQKVYTTDAVINEIEFAESKRSQERLSGTATKAPDPVAAAPADGSFVNVPEGIEEELPWN